MTKVIQCPCGYEVREPDEESLVDSAVRHAKLTHGIELTREQALAMAKPEISVAGRRDSDDQGDQV